MPHSVPLAPSPPHPLATSSDVLDTDYLVRANATGRRDFDDVAFRFADERARNRREHGDQAGLDVRLGVTDDLIDDLAAVVLILEIDRRSEDDAFRHLQRADV